jgi:hypothetical protein
MEGGLTGEQVVTVMSRVTQAFAPEALAALSLAYESVMRALPTDGGRAVSREAVAKMLIALAKSGERDTQRLVRRALLAFANCKLQ